MKAFSPNTLHYFKGKKMNLMTMIALVSITSVLPPWCIALTRDSEKQCSYI